MKKNAKRTSSVPLKNKIHHTANSATIDFKIVGIVIAYLLIDFLPYFDSVEIIYPQFLYLSVLNFVVFGFIALNPSYFDTSVFSVFKKSYVFWAYLAFTLLCMLSIVGARNISLSIISVIQMLVVFGIFINFSLLLYRKMQVLYTIAFLIGISLFFQALLTLNGFRQVAETESFLSALQSNHLKGNTGNVNIFAASVLIKIPFILMAITHFNAWRKWFLSLTLALACTSVFLVSARAAILSLLIIFISFIIFYFKTYKLSGAVILRVFLFLVLPMLIAFGASNFILKKSNDGGRYSSTAARLGQININSKDNSIKLRLLFWKNAVNFTKEKPVFGIGLGNWRIESIPYEPKGGLDISLHTHNDFLEIFAETGVLNGLIYLSLFIALLLVNGKMVIKADDQQAKLFAFLALMLLVVYGIDSIFNFPMYRPTMKFGFCMLLIITIFNGNKLESTIGYNKLKCSFWLFLFVALPIYFNYYGFKTSQLEKSILLDNTNIDNNLPTALSGDSIVRFHPKYPNVLVTSESFVEHAAVYYIYEKKHSIAKKYLDSADKINRYLATPDFLRYYMAVVENKADSAYFFIKTSFYQRPSVERNFKKAIETAAFKKDTVELYKMYRAVSALKNTSANWEIVYNGLQNAGLSASGLQKFISQGLNQFANDSLVINRRNLFHIQKYLVEGQRLFLAGQHSKALQEYKKGLALDPTNVFVMQNIGFYYYNLGQTEQAISYFLKALQKPGLTGGQTEFYLAQCYLKNNDVGKACQCFQIAQAAGFSGAAEALAKFCK
jgi:O-antigen ligase